MYTIVADDIKGLYGSEVMICDGGKTIPHTLKVAMSIVLGKKLIQREWIEDSASKTELKPIEQYEIPLDVKTRKSKTPTPTPNSSLTPASSNIRQV